MTLRARSLTTWAGRALLSVVFLKGGLDQVREPGGRAEKAADLGLPQPELQVRANGIVMLVGGAALALGVYPRAAAAVLAASLVPTTIAGHPFWTLEDQQRAMQATQFRKNLAIAGGLLVVAAGDG